MYIGLTFDTYETYKTTNSNMIYHDFTSLTEVTSLKRAIERIGHSVELIGNHKDLLNKLSTTNSKYDMIFNLVEGIASRNREGIVASILEAYNIPYIGTDAYGLSLSMNKMHSKLIAEYLQITTPEYIEIVCESDVTDLAISALEFPIVVKPCCEGTSTGVFLAYDLQQAKKHIRYLLKAFNHSVLCEKYVQGIEIGVPIIGTGDSAKIMGIVEYTTEDNEPLELFTTELKVYDDYKIHIATLPTKIKDSIQNSSLKIYRYLGASDFGRIDFRVNKFGVPYFLEANLIPSLEYKSSFSICGESIGLEYHQVINLIIQSALDRQMIIHDNNT